MADMRSAGPEICRAAQARLDMPRPEVPTLEERVKAEMANQALACGSLMIEGPSPEMEAVAAALRRREADDFERRVAAALLAIYGIKGERSPTASSS